MTRAAVQPARELRIAEGEMLLVDKPKGWTSFDVVNKIRHLFHVRRVGHAGTLDPQATGLLIVCSGSKTRDLAGFSDLDKDYEGEMKLGGRTASFDAETPVVDERSVEGIGGEQIREAFARFVGKQQQVPPMWSAVKVKGRPLYRYARKGVDVERRPREVEVFRLTPDRIEIPLVGFSVACSKGTYIRALVNDIGAALGCGAYLTALRRTRIGPYKVEDALTIADLTGMSAREVQKT